MGVVGGRDARGPVGGAVDVVGEAVEAAFDSEGVVDGFSVLAVSSFVTAGEAGVERAARGDLGASPRSR